MKCAFSRKGTGIPSFLNELTMSVTTKILLPHEKSSSDVFEPVMRIWEQFRTGHIVLFFTILKSSVADPDSNPDLHVFSSPGSGSGSGSFYH